MRRDGQCHEVLLDECIKKGTHMRLALAGAGLVLMAGMVSACGGSAEDAPEDASKGDFCDAWKAVGEADGEDDTEDAINELKDVGTPEGIPDGARDGFVIALDFFDEHKGESDDDAMKALEDMSEGDSKKMGEFTAYATKTCA